MKKINIFSLFFIVLGIGLFCVAPTAGAWEVEPTIVWNTPEGNVVEDIPQVIDEGDWVFVAHIEIDPSKGGSNFGFSGVNPSADGVNIFKLTWPDIPVYNEFNVQIGTIKGGTLYKASKAEGTISGTFYMPSCTNQPPGKFYLDLYVESPDPYTPDNFCIDYVTQDGVCIEVPTVTPTIYSPENNCPSDQGYVYQDGICIKSTIVYTQTCGNNIKEGTEQCDGTAGGCSGDDYCISPGQANECTCAAPPAVTLLEPTADYCAGQAIFRWQYSSAQSYPQGAWQMQVGTNSNFASGIIYDSGKVSTSASTKFFGVAFASLNPTSSCAPDCDHINYGVPYYWRVKVWDSADHSSVGYTTYVNPATSPINTYTFPYKHPGPAVSYTVDPATTTPGKLVSFTDNNSTCYNDYDSAEGSSYPCNSKTTNTYQWWYGDGYNTSATSCTAPVVCSAAHHTYIQNNPYPLQTRLQICDDSGNGIVGCCSAFRNISVGPSTPNPIPQWWEISPY